MSPVSGPVLGCAALLASPTLLHVIEGTAPPSLVLSRFLISVAICWMAFEVLAMIVGPAPRSQHVEGSADSAPDKAEGQRRG